MSARHLTSTVPLAVCVRAGHAVHSAHVVLGALTCRDISASAECLLHSQTCQNVAVTESSLVKFALRLPPRGTSYKIVQQQGEEGTSGIDITLLHV